MFGLFSTSKPLSPPDPEKLRLRHNETQKLNLSDGRTIGFATYGSTDVSCPVIFLFHGLPGCRLVGRSWDKLCSDIGARLVTIDRPGCGASTLSDRGLVDWPSDVLSVADHLHIERFSVLGASGGGPFALACARFISKERLRSTTVVCGIGPLEAYMDTTPLLSWRLMGIMPWLLRLVVRHLFLPYVLIRPYLTRDPSRLKRVLQDQARTPEEKAEIRDDNGSETNLDDVVASLLEAFRQGQQGCIHDGAVLTNPWGFDLKEIDSERVQLVHGDQDVQAPVKVAQWIDRQLGGGRLRVLEGITHFTIWKRYSEEMFRQLATA
jgi:pimeloyl-ACP methyl ester carboxylesterase